MSDPHDNSIPVLHEILVPGRAPQTRDAPGSTAAPTAQPGAGSAGQPAAAAEPELYAPHVADHTHAKRPRPHHGIHARHGHEELHEEVHEEREVSTGVFDRGEPGVPLEAGATVPPDLGYEAEHHAADQASHDATREGAAPQPQLDADVIAERLRGRFAGLLAGDARSLIEARCRDALQQHTSLLVGQITTEVVRTLEAEMNTWVRKAVADEIARRSGRE